MPGTILENLSGKKLSVLVGLLLICQVVCFLIGGLIAPTPAGYQYILSSVCLDDTDGQNKTDKWFDGRTCKKIDLHNFETHGQDIADKLVFAFRMPLAGVDYSRWQQSLVGVLQIDMSWTSEKAHMDPRKVLSIDARLAYQNKGDSKWHHYASATEQRIMECHVNHPISSYPYNCSNVPLFELGSLHHDYYLLNLRLPVDHQQNKDLDRITDIGLTAIFQNGGFTKVWLGMKTVFFPFIVGIMLWFWRRVHLLSRSPALLEYMLLYLGAALTFLNLPLEYLSLSFDMPFMLLLADIRQGVFYALLLSFWLVFAGEHMLIQDNGEKNTLKIYWKHLSAIVIGCLSLFIFDLCERGVQLRNPFYSIWVTDIGTTLALSFIILAGISACIYFVFLCYMVWMVFCNITVKRSTLPTMSRARRLHYEGIIYRFNFLMLTTLVCAALTVVWFILGQVAEGQFKWDEHLKLELTSAFFTGVYGMWNIYIFAMLILYAPSHKQWPADTINGTHSKRLLNFCIAFKPENNAPFTENSVSEEIEFSRLPTDPSPSEISSLTSFARKVTID